MRPPSRVRLCSVFKEPVPSSGGFPVSRRRPSKSRAFFRGRPEAGSCQKALSDFLGFCSLERSGPGIAGGGEDTEVAAGCQAQTFCARKKRAPEVGRPRSPRGGRRVRANRRRGPWTRSGARREFAFVRRTEPNPLRVNRFPPPHLSVCLLEGRLSSSIGRRNPTKVGFRLDECARRHSSAVPGAGKRRRRPSIVQPPARSAASVAG